MTIGDEHHHISGAQGFLTARDPQLLDGVIRAADSGRVQQRDRNTLQNDLALQQVASGPRQVGHNRPLTPTQTIEQ